MVIATADVLVIGAGLAGLTTAFALARRGAKVVVLEREIAGRHASTLNAGGVRRVNRHPAEMPLAEAAFALWPRLSDVLGADVGFRASGHLLVAEDDAELGRLAARAAQGVARGPAGALLPCLRHTEHRDAVLAADRDPKFAPVARERRLVRLAADEDAAGQALGVGGVARLWVGAVADDPAGLRINQVDVRGAAASRGDQPGIRAGAKAVERNGTVVKRLLDHRSVRGNNPTCDEAEGRAVIFVEACQVDRGGDGVGQGIDHAERVRILVAQPDGVALLRSRRCGGRSCLCVAGSGGEAGGDGKGRQYVSAHRIGHEGSLPVSAGGR